MNKARELKSMINLLIKMKTNIYKKLENAEKNNDQLIIEITERLLKQIEADLQQCYWEETKRRKPGSWDGLKAMVINRNKKTF